MPISARFLRAAATAAIAAALTLPALAETIYVQAGKVLAVPGEAPLGQTTIVVTDGKIASLEPGFKVPKDKSVRVIDLKDSYVLPGLIDSHVHLTSDTGGIASQLEDVTLSPAAQAFNAWDNGMKTLKVQRQFYAVAVRQVVDAPRAAQIDCIAFKSSLDELAHDCGKIQRIRFGRIEAGEGGKFLLGCHGKDSSQWGRAQRQVSRRSYAAPSPAPSARLR